MIQEKMRLLLIEDDFNEVKNFEEYVATINDVELLGNTNSASEGLEMVRELRPDGIVLDLELTEGDGLDFLIRLREFPVVERPYVVVTTNTTARVTLQALRDNGAGFILVKTIRGYSSKQVVDKFRMVRKYFRSRIVEDEEDSATPAGRPGQESYIRWKLSEDLDRLGITPNLNGHNYIIDAVLLLILDADGNSDVSNKVYPVIAKKYGKQVANIERSIRSAIETAWVNTAPEELKKNYTAAIRPDKGKPMNKEFICFFAAKYRRK